MCDLINNHTDGGENWTLMCCHVGEKGEIIIKGEKTVTVTEIRLFLLRFTFPSLESCSFWNTVACLFYCERFLVWVQFLQSVSHPGFFGEVSGDKPPSTSALSYGSLPRQPACELIHFVESTFSRRAPTGRRWSTGCICAEAHSLK